MSLSDIPVRTLTDTPTTLGELTLGKPALIVNVASRCGLTPQYGGLVELQERYGPRGFTVIGVPCNQFAGQEPGSAEEIREFCSTTYGVDFPLLEKTDVNGPGRHPLYAELTQTADEAGEAGDVRWNFEKFLIDAEGRTVARFRPGITPDDPSITSAIEKLL
ncbi:glutathione peroxidase [Nonomuraea sp. SYSU D8015]|uniref:glutathione peroxidase n=1 Tax=Nonomuraea sp. SYSU D8015 TaxID=2593644 RepID=UPI001661296B|nr:glutathione peroxidase [Nonomuraea sp. SYSU D8015]